MILQKIKKSIEKIGIPCFLDYNDATSYCAVLIPETNGKESIKVDIQFIWEDGNPILLADEWIKSLRMNKELKVIVLGSENNYAGYVLRVKVIDVSICSYIPTGNRYTITIVNDSTKGTVSGAGKYLEGKTCTLTAYPFEQYYFVGWLTPDDDVVHENPYSFTVEGDATYESYFLSKYHVEVVSAGNGTVSGSGYYGPTESCTITATPNTGYHFVNWTVSGLELTTDNPYSFIPTGDITITANFAINTYTISTSGTGGTITGSGTYNYGATCTLTATANTGYEFRRWMEYGETISTSNPYSFTVNSDRTITADFNQLSYTVSATSSGNGSVSGGGTYHYGDSITLTATPDEGYVFVDWTEGGSTLSSSNPYTFSCTGNQTIVGNFEEFSAPLIINTLGNATAVLTNSNSQDYTWNLSEGENVYEGTEPGFALDEITGVSVGNDTQRQFVSIDATGLTSWQVIDAYEFAGCENLQSILLPDSITTIGRNAFESCNSLTSIVLPASLTSMDEYAFNMSMVYSITFLSTTPPTLSYDIITGGNDYCNFYIPSGTLTAYQTACPDYIDRFVEDTQAPAGDYLEIESYSNTVSVVFSNSSNQTYTWNLNKGKNYYTGTEPGFSLNEITGLMKGSDNYLILSIDASKLTSWTTVGNNALSTCECMGKLILPDSITTIDSQGLYYSRCLPSLTLPASLTNLGYYALGDCSQLRSINIPANVSSIGSMAFLYCLNLERITVDSNNTTYNDGNGSNCIIRTAINSIIQGCKGTVIPSTATNVGHQAFQQMGLTSITIPSTLASVSSMAFYGNYFTSINIPSTLLTIGERAFNGCNSLEYITVDSNNPFFNDGNGSNCIIRTSDNTLLTACRNTVIPNTVRTIGYGAFTDIPIESIIVPEGVITIEKNAFNYCPSTKSLSLPSTLTTIGNYAFAQDYELAFITIPVNVSSIGRGAFDSEFAYVEFEGTTPATIGDNAFSSQYNYPIYVPSAAVSDYQTAWPTYASRIQAKPQPSGSDYLRVDSHYSYGSIILMNSNNQTYTWNLNPGINYYEGTEPGFAINEITGLMKDNDTYGSLYFVDASKLTSWTTIENDVFYDNRLNSMILPSSITTIIGDGAFNSWSMGSITLLSTTPPTCTGYPFEGNYPIYVPAASVNDYKTAWSEYASRIQAIPTP